ncbi:hypothetical protein D3C76_1440130 [compost metagenome]
MHLCGGNRRLIAQHCGLQLIEQRLLLVQGLARYAVVGAEQLVTLEVDPGDLQLRLALTQLRFGLLEAGADRPIVNGGQQITLLDPLTFFDQ